MPIDATIVVGRPDNPSGQPAAAHVSLGRSTIAKHHRSSSGATRLLSSRASDSAGRKLQTSDVKPSALRFLRSLPMVIEHFTKKWHEQRDRRLRRADSM